MRKCTFFNFRILLTFLGLMVFLQRCDCARKPVAKALKSSAVPPALADLIEGWRSKVVQILCYDKSSKFGSAGTGFLIEDGDIVYIVTNRHVLELEEKPEKQEGMYYKLKKNYVVQIMLEKTKKTCLAEFIGACQEPDVALLRLGAKELKTMRKDLSSFSLSKKEPKPGAAVASLGYPYTEGFYATNGHVGDEGRAVLEPTENSSFNRYIVHTATINPGCSGGPVIAIKRPKEVAGMNTYKRNVLKEGRGYTAEGYNIAIPARDIARVVEDLKKGQPFQRPALGMFVKPVSYSTALKEGIKVQGALVMDFSKNSAAKDAGLQKGDIILKVGDVLLEDHFHLQEAIFQHWPGDTVTLTYYRPPYNSKVQTEQTVTLKLFKKDDFSHHTGLKAISC